MEPSLPSSLPRYHGNLRSTSISVHESSEFLPSVHELSPADTSPTRAPSRPNPRTQPALWADEVGLNYAARLVFYDLILRGRHVAGIRSWAQTMGVHHNTVAKALAELETLGVVRLETQERGLPTRVSLAWYQEPAAWAEVSSPWAEVAALDARPGAVVHTPTWAEVSTTGSDSSGTSAQADRPSAEALHLVTPLREVKESFSLLEGLSNALPSEYRDQFWIEKDAGGRVRLEQTMSRLADVHGAAMVVSTLLARVPRDGVHSIVAYLLKQARLLEGERSSLPGTRTTPVTPVTPTAPSESPPIALADPVLDDAVSFARLQARSVAGPDEVPTVRRGIELEFAHDARACAAAIDAFEQLVAV